MSSPTIPPVSTMGAPIPYLTLDEVKRNPIYSQLRQMVPNTSPTDRDAELNRIITRVSAMINGEVNQNLAATVDKEVGEVTISPRGDLRIFTRGSPIIDVVSLSVGRNVYNLTPITDFSHMVLDPWCITIPAGGGSPFTGSGGLSSGNLPNAGFGRPGQRLWAEWVYVNGFPVTTLAADAAAGDTSITVGDSTGIIAGQTLLTIEDGIYLETVTPSAVNGNVLTIPPLACAHKTGVGVHDLPGDIKNAALTLISRLHDTWSLSLASISTDGNVAKYPESGANRAMCAPAVMLNPYKRRW